jgi:ketosteroid isomerase-like protein
MSRSAVETVELALERFSAGDDEGFVAALDPDVVVWADPQLAPGVVMRGREQLAGWCREARERWKDVTFAHGELSEHGAGVFVELDVIAESTGGGGAWRLPMAVFVRDGLVVEAIPKADRQSAIAALLAG